MMLPPDTLKKTWSFSCTNGVRGRWSPVFDREVSGKGASAEDWERIVLARTVDFPEGYEIPSGVNRNAVPWPDILADYSLMSTPGKGWSAAWQSYSGEKHYPIKPVDHPYDCLQNF